MRGEAWLLLAAWQRMRGGGWITVTSQSPTWSHLPFGRRGSWRGVAWRGVAQRARVRRWEARGQRSSRDTTGPSSGAWPTAVAECHVSWLMATAVAMSHQFDALNEIGECMCPRMVNGLAEKGKTKAAANVGVRMQHSAYHTIPRLHKDQHRSHVHPLGQRTNTHAKNKNQKRRSPAHQHRSVRGLEQKKMLTHHTKSHGDVPGLLSCSRMWEVESLVIF